VTTFAVVTIAAALAAAAQQATNRPAPPVSPTSSAPAERMQSPQALAFASRVAAEFDALELARAAEAHGKFGEAVRMYRELARTGNGFAAKRLGEIYSRGVPGIDRDQAQALRWYREAELHGEVLAQAVRLR
jgi:TPR repeat protein